MNMRIRKIMEGMLFLVLSCVIVFCMAGTVRGQGDFQQAEKEKFYREKEDELLAETKAALRKLGYSNSGVTLTKVVDGERNYVYTFTIHHYRLDNMDEPVRRKTLEELTRGLSVLTEDFPRAVPEDEIQFCYEYLIL